MPCHESGILYDVLALKLSIDPLLINDGKMRQCDDERRASERLCNAAAAARVSGPATPRPRPQLCSTSDSLCDYRRIVASSSDSPCGCGESPFVREVVEVFSDGLHKPLHSENRSISPRSLDCAEKYFGFHCGAACASRKDGMTG